MKVTLVQQDIVWGKPEDNRRNLEEILAQNRGSDLYVFPEMFTTGFATTEGSSVDTRPEDTLQWMRSKAAQYDAAMVGSVAMQDSDKFVNRMFFAKPDSEVTVYDKHHLFRYGGEHLRFNAGKDRVIVEYKGVRLLLLICYDLRFPVWSRNTGDYDAIICVASWPDVRQTAWETLIRARAIENEAVMIAVNRVGTDPVCSYLGGSTMYDAFGEVIARCADRQFCAVTGELDMKTLGEYRKKFPVAEDRDQFSLL